MKLVKRRGDAFVASMIKEKMDYIKDYWMDITDEDNRTIGVITGYKINIPFLLHNIITEKGTGSFFQLDAISYLCSELWFFLHKHVDLLKGKSGDLYFLNNVHVYDNEFSFGKEQEVLRTLIKRTDIVVYSCGRSELFDDFFNRRDTRYWFYHKEMLLKDGWVHDKESDFFIFNHVNIRKKEFPPSEKPIRETPYEYWVKMKGLDWMYSFWKAFIKKKCFQKHWHAFKSDIKNNRYEYRKNQYVNPIRFLRNLKFVDFKQYDPKRQYAGAIPLHTENLRSEGVVMTFKNKKYQMFFNQQHKEMIEDEFSCGVVLVGVYNKHENTFIVGADEPFTCTAMDWMEDIFIAFFNAIYEQYEAENQPADNVISLYAQ